MADMLELPQSTYSRYEDPDDFKKPFLPMDLARRIAGALADHGINQAEVLRLAGIEESNDEPPLSLSESRWLETLRKLSPSQRKLILQVADEMIEPGAGLVEPRPTATVHAQERPYRATDARG